MSQNDKFMELYSQATEESRNNYIPKKELYDQIVKFLLTNEAEETTPKATLNNWKYRYSIKQIEGRNILCHGLNDDRKEVVFEEELFDLLHRVHVEETGHGGRDVMREKLKNKFAVGEKVPLYLKTCANCELKKARIKKGQVTKPILETNYAERYQADLIDMQAQKDGSFAWILVVQDHFSKFVHLRALEKKEAKPIVDHIRSIFMQFGPCRIFHTDNGREFCNQHMEALMQEWNVKMVHGQPRKSSTQGSVERANQDIENIIMTWENHFQRNDWASNLELFQLMKNNRFHKGLNKTPYETVFGRKPHSMPHILEAISLEDEQQNEENDEEYEANFSAELFQEGLVEEEVVEESDYEEEGPSTKDIERRQQKITDYREYVQKYQQKQADRMVKATISRYGNVAVGTNVRIPIDQVDRGKVDPKNLLGVVMEESGGYYKIGTKEGILPHKFVRSGFAVAQTDNIGLADVPTDKTTTIRAASKASSQHGGQGFKSCNCKTGCGSRCSCRKDGRLCNSRCHSSLSCQNK